jgi:hypothetical protein
VAHPQDRPLARGHLPRKVIAGLKLRRQLEDALAGNDLVRRRRCVSLTHRDVPGHKSGLALDVLNPRVAIWRGKSEDRDILVVIGHGLGSLQGALETLRSHEVGFAPHDFLHRQLGRNPRSPAAAPAGVVVHVNFQPKPVCLAADVFKQLPPGRRPKSSRPFWCSLVHLHDQHATYPHAPHRFQVRRDAVAGDIPIQPKPVNPRTR